MHTDLAPRMPLALAFAGLDAALDLRACVDGARAAGLRAVVLDAAKRGVRPRELGRSARRELGAALRRNELAFAGVDLWIPPEHFADGLHTDRACAAVAEACELARDLAALSPGSSGVLGSSGARTVNITLPENCSPEVLLELGAFADRTSVTIADHAWPTRTDLSVDHPIRAGVDPAHVLLRGADPAAAASAIGARLAGARLSDANESGRVAPVPDGSGRLDVGAYFVALLTAGYTRPVVIDLRAVPDQPNAARLIAEHWAVRADAT